MTVRSTILLFFFFLSSHHSRAGLENVSLTPHNRTPGSARNRFPNATTIYHRCQIRNHNTPPECRETSVRRPSSVSFSEKITIARVKRVRPEGPTRSANCVPSRRPVGRFAGYAFTVVRAARNGVFKTRRDETVFYVGGHFENTLVKYLTE